MGRANSHPWPSSQPSLTRAASSSVRSIPSARQVIPRPRHRPRIARQISRFAASSGVTDIFQLRHDSLRAVRRGGTGTGIDRHPACTLATPARKPGTHSRSRRRHQFRPRTELLSQARSCQRPRPCSVRGSLSATDRTACRQTSTRPKRSITHASSNRRQVNAPRPRYSTTADCAHSVCRSLPTQHRRDCKPRHHRSRSRPATSTRALGRVVPPSPWTGEPWVRSAKLSSTAGVMKRLRAP